MFCYTGMANKTSKFDSKAYNKKWYAEHKQQCAENNKKWREAHKEYIKEYREANKKSQHELCKKWRDEHKEEVKKRYGIWYANNKLRSPKRRFSSAQRTAKYRGIKWDITFEDYVCIIENPCHYCGNKLGEPSRRSSGLDRLNSDGCYEVNNVVSCCFVCNVMKGAHLSPEETKVAVKAILAYRESHPEIVYTMYKR